MSQEQPRLFRQKILWILSALVLLTVVGCGAVIDSEGAKIGNPKDFAEATHIAAMSQESVQATATAVSLQTTRTVADIQARATAEAIANAQRQSEADKVAAQATVALARAKSEQDALPAATAGRAVAYLGIGIGALVLFMGLAFGVVAWVNKRATAIYPDKRGQFPVIIRQGLGWVAFHDPNRALGSATVARVPTLLDGFAGVVVSAVRAFRSWDTPQLPVAEPQASFALAGSEPTMLQVASQEQAAQVRIAENPDRPKIMLATLPHENAPSHPVTKWRMPQISVINDPQQIERFEQKLLGGGDHD